MNLVRICDDLLMVTQATCTCTFTMELDAANNYEVRIVGQHPCIEYPHCGFPLSEAMDKAQEAFDSDLVEAKFATLSAADSME